MAGTAAGDTVHLAAGADLAAGGLGDDLLDGLGGADTLDGGAATDTLIGGGGDDLLTSGEPRQTVAALAEQVFGGAGNDWVTIGTGFNVGPTRTFVGVTRDGGSGADSLEIIGQTEVMDLRGATLSGIEALSYAGSGLLGGVIVTAAQFNMFDDFTLSGFVQVGTAGDLVAIGAMFLTQIRLFDGGQKIDLSASLKPFSDFGPAVIGGAGNDWIIGSVRRDSFSGGAGDDSQSGGAGNDAVQGQDGSDTLRGGAGDDVLCGGLGVDQMAGGAGADSFSYFATGESAVAARDVITDFTVDAGAGTAFVDRLNLSFIDAKAGVVGNDAFVFVGGAAFTAEGQIRAFRHGAVTIVQANTTGAGGAEMEFVLQGFSGTDLSAADLVL